MQDPNEDTEWNDVLRAKGILPPKEKKDITEEDIVNMLEQTIQQKTGGTVQIGGLMQIRLSSVLSLMDQVRHHGFGENRCIPV
jgi:hypothetical protein